AAGEGGGGGGAARRRGGQRPRLPQRDVPPPPGQDGEAAGRGRRRPPRPDRRFAPEPALLGPARAAGEGRADLAGRCLVIRSLLAGGLVAGSALVMHPLGNFTVNRYDGLVAAPPELRIDHVQELAGVPAAQVLEGGAGGAGGAGLTDWAARTCATASRVFQITESGRRVHATVRTAVARTRPGQAGLPTLRLECTMTAPLANLPGGVAVSFRDPGAADHVGWDEITGAGGRVTGSRYNVPAGSRGGPGALYHTG